MARFTLQLLSYNVSIVNVQLKKDCDDFRLSGGLMRSLLTSYIIASIHHASSLSSEFFAINSNQAEVTIYASKALVDMIWKDLLLPEGLEIPNLQRSSAYWRVFQLEVLEGNDSCEVMANVTRPLSSLGFSIQYQSSSLAEFILVKENDLPQALQCFIERGWIPFNDLLLDTIPVKRDLKEALDPDDPIIGPVPASMSYDAIDRREFELKSSDWPIYNRDRTVTRKDADKPTLIGAPETGFAQSSKLLPKETYPDWRQVQHIGRDSLIPPTTMTDPEQRSRSSSQRSLPCILSQSSDALALVGLNMEMEKLWEHRIAGFLSWPEEPPNSAIIPSTRGDLSPCDRLSHTENERVLGRPSSCRRESGRPFYSFVRTAEGSSLLTTIHALKTLFPTEEERTVLLYSAGELSLDGSVEKPHLFCQDEADGTSSSIRLCTTSDWPASSGELNDDYHGADHAQPDAGDAEDGLQANISCLDEGVVRRQPGDLTLNGVPMEASHTVSSGDHAGVKRCIELNFGIGSHHDRSIHLDRAGLFLEISDILMNRQVPMLYISTYHVGNLIIASKHFDQVRALLGLYMLEGQETTP